MVIIMENNFKNEVQKLCDMQIELWNDVKNDLKSMDNSTDKEIVTMFQKYLKGKHHEAVLQLIRVNLSINKIEEQDDILMVDM